MGYEAVWKVLADMIVEFRKRGEQIPANIMEDLRSAKTLIQVLKADKTQVHSLIPQIEQYLESVEFHLFAEAQKFGEAFFKKWMQELNKAREKILRENMEPYASSVSQFIPGAPREKHWIRIHPSSEMPEGLIRKIAADEKLSCELQENGCLLISGGKEHIKSFIKKMTRKHESIS